MASGSQRGSGRKIASRTATRASVNIGKPDGRVGENGKAAGI
jgi:hypothetical protein